MQLVVEMDVQETLKFFNNDHEKLKTVIGKLSDDQILDFPVLGSWTVKDIIVHISAWNLEVEKAIDSVLRDEGIWYADQGDVEFNARAVEKAKYQSLSQVLEEWEQSFERLVKRIEDLSDEQLLHHSNQTWGGTNDLITVESLLSYRYRGEGHEGGHAKQVEEYFSKTTPE